MAAAGRTSTDVDTPQSIPTPPTGSEPIAHSSAFKAYDSFLRYSTSVEKFTRLFANARDILTLSTLKRRLPDLYQLCIDSEAERQHVFEPCKPWSFAYGLDTNGSFASLCQAVCFGRAVLEAIAVQNQLDYRPEWTNVVSDS
jgi:hypothetical protein